MAILYGTQSNGETLPVLVDQFGNLLAKGIEGAQGPPGEQGQQGEQGIPGQPGAPGAGVPTPYGEEGSYLWIKDGSPAWTTGSDPGPSPELGTIYLPDTQPWVDPNLTRGFWNESGFQNAIVANFDELMRYNPNWIDPDLEVKEGMGTQFTGQNDSVELLFDFDTTEGNIVRFWMVYQMQNSSDFSTAMGTSLCEDTQLVPVRTSWSVPNQMRSGWWVNTYFEYIITRPVKQNVKFTFSSPSIPMEWMGVCKYELESPVTWTVKQELERQQRTNAARIRSLSA